jgi:hypothetical protein
MSPLRWTCKSTSHLAAELHRKGYRIGERTVARMLQKDLKYSLQGNRKTKQGSSHPDRNAQFEYIAGQTRSFQQRGQPVVSVDAKKKEPVGEFKNAGREWQPQGLRIPGQAEHPFRSKLNTDSNGSRTLIPIEAER